MNEIEQSILKLDGRLKNAGMEYAFLGGSVLSLLVTDPAADAIRVTKDVDVMVDVKSRKEFHNAERTLERLGFAHDTREGAPICRWICDGITVDVLPIREEVLGWRSRWFERALAKATAIERDGREFKVVAAPYFVALKLEAFEDRGQGDFVASTDFEDVICLFNGRETIVEEIKADEELRPALAEKFRRYLQCAGLEDAVDGFVQTEENGEARKEAIMRGFAELAEG